MPSRLTAALIEVPQLGKCRKREKGKNGNWSRGEMEGELLLPG